MTSAAMLEDPPATYAAAAGTRGVLTIAEFEAAYVGRDFELVRGKLVPMSKNNLTHSRLVIRLSHRLCSHLEGKPAEVLGGDVGFVTSESENTSRAMDVAVISKERLAKQAAGRPFLTAAPELAVEISSPSNSFGDMMDKVEEYFACGVQNVWIVDPDHSQVLVYASTTDVKVLKAAKGDALTGVGVLEGFTLPLAELFA